MVRNTLKLVVIILLDAACLPHGRLINLSRCLPTTPFYADCRLYPRLADPDLICDSCLAVVNCAKPVQLPDCSLHAQTQS